MPFNRNGGIIVTYDEYMAGEPDDEDEVLGEYLLDEPDDLTLVMLPKLEFNLDDTIESFYKVLKRCKNKTELKSVLYQFYAYISGVVSLQNDIDALQNKAKEIEFNIKVLQGEYEVVEE